MSRAAAGAHLQGASLPGAHLFAACLLGANLQGAHIEDTYLEGRPTTLKRSGPTASFPSPTTDFSRRTTEDCCWVEFSRRVGQHPTLLVLSPLNWLLGEATSDCLGGGGGGHHRGERALRTGTPDMLYIRRTSPPSARRLTCLTSSPRTTRVRAAPSPSPSFLPRRLLVAAAATRTASSWPAWTRPAPTTPHGPLSSTRN
jgi:hypothetical protein